MKITITEKVLTGNLGDFWGATDINQVADDWADYIRPILESEGKNMFPGADEVEVEFDIQRNVSGAGGGITILDDEGCDYEQEADSLTYSIQKAWESFVAGYYDDKEV